MKQITTLRYFLSAQPIRHLWISTLALLACFCFLWYAFVYRPLICATQNLEDRLALCSQMCEKGAAKQTDVKNLERTYRATVSLLNEYKGGRDEQTFYHQAVDNLLNALHNTHCDLTSFNCGMQSEHPVCHRYQATLICNGTRAALASLLSRFSDSQLSWRVATVAIEVGRDDQCQMSLGLECLVLL